MLELAKACKRTDVPVTLTKLDAAQQQLEGAIQQLFFGNWACAVTLAGAAEGILPETGKCDDIFSVARHLAVEDHGRKEKEFSTNANKLVHWLKHNQKDKPNFAPTYSIEQEDAVRLILRAYSRFSVHLTPLAPNQAPSKILHIFDQWFQQVFPDWMPPDPTDREK